MLIDCITLDTTDGVAMIRTTTPALLFFLPSQTSVIPKRGLDMKRLGILILWHTKDVQELKEAHEAVIATVRLHGLLKIRRACDMKNQQSAELGMMMLSALFPIEVLSLIKRVL